MNKDRFTTIIGAISGLAGIAKNFVPAELSPILDAVAGLCVAILGYFVAKKV